MIIGLGLDVVEIDRIARSWTRFGNRFAEKILTRAELSCLPTDPVRYLAVRFAAKEAGAKALGTGFADGVTLHCFEIRSLSSGKPELFLLGRAGELAGSMGVTGAHISLTHGRDTAAAVVVLEG